MRSLTKGEIVQVEDLPARQPLSRSQCLLCRSGRLLRTLLLSFRSFGLKFYSLLLFFKNLFSREFLGGIFRNFSRENPYIHNVCLFRLLQLLENVVELGLHAHLVLDLKIFFFFLDLIIFEPFFTNTC